MRTRVYSVWAPLLLGASLSAPAVAAENMNQTGTEGRGGSQGHSAQNGGSAGDDVKVGATNGSEKPGVRMRRTAEKQKDGSEGKTQGAWMKTGGSSTAAMGNDALLPEETINAVQTALQTEGFYQGEVDGIVGPKTSNALRAYQRQQNLEATGRLDAETIRQLGVNLPGSEVQPVRGVDQEADMQGQGQGGSSGTRDGTLDTTRPSDGTQQPPMERTSPPTSPDDDADDMEMTPPDLDGTDPGTGSPGTGTGTGTGGGMDSGSTGGGY